MKAGVKWTLLGLARPLVEVKRRDTARNREIPFWGSKFSNFQV
jgi:hypothetical protein